MVASWCEVAALWWPRYIVIKWSPFDAPHTPVYHLPWLLAIPYIKYRYIRLNVCTHLSVRRNIDSPDLHRLATLSLLSPHMDTNVEPPGALPRHRLLFMSSWHAIPRLPWATFSRDLYYSAPSIVATCARNDFSVFPCIRHTDHSFSNPP